VHFLESLLKPMVHSYHKSPNMSILFTWFWFFSLYRTSQWITTRGNSWRS
jgi:hypothetical protein